MNPIQCAQSADPAPNTRKKVLTGKRTGYTFMIAIHKGQIVECIFARPSVISRIILSEGSSVDAPVRFEVCRERECRAHWIPKAAITIPDSA
jgi:hypothetical protein